MIVALRRIPRPLVRSGSPRVWLVAMTLIAVGGTSLAAYQAPVGYLMKLASLSRLGLDERAGPVMNATLVALGATLIAFGVSLLPVFGRLRGQRRLSARAEQFIEGGLAAAAVFLAATGLFPVESPASTVVHNAAGFAMPVILMLTIGGARLSMGSMGSDFDRASVIVVTGAAGTFGVTWQTRLIPYPVMEAVCFGLIGIWLWLFEDYVRRVERSARPNHVPWVTTSSRSANASNGSHPRPSTDRFSGPSAPAHGLPDRRPSSSPSTDSGG